MSAADMGGKTAANPARGEAGLRVGGAQLRLRPSFAALVAAEGEIGSLFALVERVGEGRMELGETVALLWHCLDRPPDSLTRTQFSTAMTEQGLAMLTPPLGQLIGQILRGY